MIKQLYADCKHQYTRRYIYAIVKKLTWQYNPILILIVTISL